MRPGLSGISRRHRCRGAEPEGSRIFSRLYPAICRPVRRHRPAVRRPWDHFGWAQHWGRCRRDLFCRESQNQPVETTFSHSEDATDVGCSHVRVRDITASRAARWLTTGNFSSGAKSTAGRPAHGCFCLRSEHLSCRASPAQSFQSFKKIPAKLRGRQLRRLTPTMALICARASSPTR